MPSGQGASIALGVSVSPSSARWVVVGLALACLSASGLVHPIVEPPTVARQRIVLHHRFRDPPDRWCSFTRRAGPGSREARDLAFHEEWSAERAHLRPGSNLDAIEA